MSPQLMERGSSSGNVLLMGIIQRFSKCNVCDETQQMRIVVVGDHEATIGNRFIRQFIYYKNRPNCSEET